jgi:hypothetical protein
MNSLLTNIVRVSVDLIEPHPENPRIGDIEAIKRSLELNKQFQPVLVQRDTGFIIAGNHTYMAAVELGWEEIDVVYLDVDDIKAKAIMLAANKTADLGSYDEKLLAQLVSDISVEEEVLLSGTGFSSEEIDDLLALSVSEPSLEPLEGEEEENVEVAAVFLDKIAPIEDEETDDSSEEEDDDVVVQQPFLPQEPVTNNINEFVIFRFGELRAKVSRKTYERFLKRFLKENGYDLSSAGMAAAIKLGIEPELVEPAVVKGAERWL